MRVSGGGRRTNPINTNRRTTTNSLEEKILKGKQSINVSKNSQNTENVKENNIENEKTNFDIETKNTEIEKTVSEKDIINLENEKKSSSKSKNKKQKKNKYSSEIKPIGKLSKKRIACIVLAGTLSSTIIGGVVYGAYYNIIRYPWQMEENIETSGLGGINRWVSVINTLDNETIKSEIGSDSYLAKELEYANGNENKISFIKTVIGTVEYSPEEIPAKNIYGNYMINREDNSIVMTDSLVNGVDEEVKLSYIDYSKIPLDEQKIKNLMKEEGVVYGIGDYSNSLVNVFCKYISSLEEIPLVSVDYKPNLINNGSKYYMTTDEDIYLDKVLFSSKEFHDLLIKFSEVAAKGETNPEWSAWNSLSDEDKKDKQEPSKTIENLVPTSAWNDWNSKSNDDKAKTQEPLKYDSNKVISNSWCGSYSLLNEYETIWGNDSKPVEAEVGDGSIENPAKIGTGVVTSIFTTDSNGNRVSSPIKVKLVDFKVSQDALNYFESKDTRNRGYDIKSEVQYASYTFEVTNLSNETLTIYDNSALSDGLANISPRTGTVYGLQNSVTLKPYETGVIESWGNSTELNKKYVIWGGDFNREAPVVWFRVLAGDIDDPSEDKGVTINNKEER